MNKITIYTNETCPYCKSIKEELTKNNIEFEEKLTKDFVEEWQQMADLTGMSSVPTILYGEELLVPGRDFSNPDHLTSIIKNKPESKYSEQRQILERLKTLNFNISQAFQNLDGILRKLDTKDVD